MCFSTEFQFHTDRTFHNVHCLCFSGCIVLEDPGFEGPLWEQVYRTAGPQALLTEAREKEKLTLALSLSPG